MEIKYTHCYFFLLTLFILGGCNTGKEILGTKQRTYQVKVIPFKSSVHLLLDEQLSGKSVSAISLPYWKGCNGTSSKGPISKCTTLHLNDFFNSNIQIPGEALSNALEGYAHIKFKLNKSGLVEDIEVLKEPGGGIGIEMERLIASLPPWESAQINEQDPVDTRIEMEIFFDLVLR